MAKVHLRPAATIHLMWLLLSMHSVTASPSPPSALTNITYIYRAPPHQHSFNTSRTHSFFFSVHNEENRSFSDTAIQALRRIRRSIKNSTISAGKSIIINDNDNGLSIFTSDVRPNFSQHSPNSFRIWQVHGDGAREFHNLVKKESKSVFLNDFDQSIWSKATVSSQKMNADHSGDVITSVGLRRNRDTNQIFHESALYDQLKDHKVQSQSLQHSSHYFRHGHIPSSLRETGRLNHESPLEWIVEPESRVVFSNNTGGILHCQARSSAGPQPTVQWMYDDGRPYNQVSGLVEVLSNGSLSFLPFDARRYEASLHAATLTCTVSSEHGALVSRPVTVRAVISETYEVQVYDQVVLAGNPALLRCRLPINEENVVVVTSWIKDGTVNIFPSTLGDGKHHLTENGDLLILSVTSSDGQSFYQCRTLDTITGLTNLSPNPARLIVTESTSSVPPRIHEAPSRFTAEQGGLITLPCLAEGSPPPAYTWRKEGRPLSRQSSPPWPGELISPRTVGGSLVFSSVLAADAGEYQCLANNSAGQDTRVILLAVTVPLAVQVTPAWVRVDVGSRLSLKCSVAGQPVESVTWYKDAKRLRSSNRLRLLTREELVLSPVHSGDAGLYQCVASSGENGVVRRSVAHAHATVILGASAPRLVYRFIAHTLQPGPAVTLKCIARATPTPHISWTLDGFPMPQSQRFLIGQYVSTHGDVISHVNISSVRVSDGGLYQCEARNSAGTEAHSARLNVYGPPTIRQIGPMTAIAGQLFRVACPVGGHPIDKIIWKKDGRELPTSHSQQVDSAGVLTISMVSRDGDQGRYTCTAMGRQDASDTQHLDLAVVVPPHLGPLVFPVGTREGMRAQSTCFVQEGDLPIEIYWEKDGARLKPSTDVKMTHVDDFTSMLTISSAQAEHSGNYTCFARNAASSVATSAQLSVNVQPTWLLEPHDTSIPVGGFVDVPCQADGFPLPDLTWQRKTVSGAWATVEKLFDDSMINQIMRTKGTIIAGYKNEESPKTNIFRSMGEDFDSRGADQGNFDDQHESENLSSDGVPGTNVNVGRDHQPLTLRKAINGTLVLVGAVREYEGLYLCRASNGVGSGLSKVITVTVHEPPWFAKRRRLVQVEVGSSAALSCRAFGDPPLQLTWTKDGVALPSGARYIVRDLEAEDQSQVQELSIRAASVEDSGVFVCEATNPHGSTATDFTLVVEDVPATPNGLRVQESGSRYVILAWSPSSISAPVDANIVAYSPQDRDTDASFREISVTQAATNYRLEGLDPDTWYSFTIAAQNRVGRSSPSAIVRHRTREEKPEGQPRDIQVSSHSPTSLRVRWLAPLLNQTHGRLLGYYLGIKEHSSSEGSPFNFTTVGGAEGVSAALTQATVASLRPHTRYYIILQAFNSMGSGPASDAVIGVTLQDKPYAPPSAVSCLAASPTRIDMRWQPPPPRLANGDIRSYHISYDVSPEPGSHASNVRSGSPSSASVISIFPGSSAVMAPPVTGSASSRSSNLKNSQQINPLGGVLVTENLQTEFGGLFPWSNYSFTVAAATEAGVGVASDPVVCSTQEDVPDAPTTVKAVATGPSSIIVSWSRPMKPRGRLTYFTVHWNISEHFKSKTRTKEVDSSFDHLQLKDLPQELLTVWVSGSTGVGEGPPSNVITISPSKTGTVRAAIWSVGGEVTTTWRESATLPCRSVGVPEPSKVWWHDGKILDYAAITSTGLLGDGGLRLSPTSRHHNGRYTCEVTNPFGTDSVTYTVTVRVPPSAPSLHVTETTASSIRLQWDVADDGGTTVTHYTLYYRAAGGETMEREVHDESHTVYDLRCGTEYHFYLLAHNVIGSSESSNVVVARTKGRAPEAPPQFQFVTSNSSQAMLYLAQWQSGGCPISHFSVEYRDSMASQHWTTVSSEVLPSRTFALTGLQGGVTYDVRVTAHNAAGTTKEHYSISTPVDSVVGSGRSWDGLEGTIPSARRLPFFKDLRIVIPVSVSLVALLLTLSKVCLCIRKNKEDPKMEERTYVSSGDMDNNRKIISPDVGLGMQELQPPSAAGGNEGCSSDSDAYQYASASCQLGRLSPPPPPPAPPSPADHQRGCQSSFTTIKSPYPDTEGNELQQRSYASLVYQVPSLSNVNSANKDEALGADLHYPESRTGDVFFCRKPQYIEEAADPLHYQHSIPQDYMTPQHQNVIISQKEKRKIKFGANPKHFSNRNQQLEGKYQPDDVIHESSYVYPPYRSSRSEQQMTKNFNENQGHLEIQPQNGANRQTKYRLDKKNRLV